MEFHVSFSGNFYVYCYTTVCGATVLPEKLGTDVALASKQRLLDTFHKAVR